MAVVKDQTVTALWPLPCPSRDPAKPDRVELALWVEPAQTTLGSRSCSRRRPSVRRSRPESAAAAR